MAELSRLLAVKKEAEASLQDVERIIYETEEAYFNECTSGNAMKGWGDYIEAEERAAVESVEREATVTTSRLPRKRDERKRKMADENRLFSYGSYFFKWVNVRLCYLICGSPLSPLCSHRSHHSHSDN